MKATTILSALLASAAVVNAQVRYDDDDAQYAGDSVQVGTDTNGCVIQRPDGGALTLPAGECTGTATAGVPSGTDVGDGSGSGIWNTASVSALDPSLSATATIPATATTTTTTTQTEDDGDDDDDDDDGGGATAPSVTLTSPSSSKTAGPPYSVPNNGTTTAARPTGSFTFTTSSRRPTGPSDTETGTATATGTATPTQTGGAAAVNRAVGLLALVAGVAAFVL